MTGSMRTTGQSRYSPEALFLHLRAVRYSDPAFDIFSNANRQWRENWCAARLARAFERAGTPCAVWAEDANSQRAFDFQLEVGGELLPFQTTEVLHAGRLRNKELRELPSTPTFDDRFAKEEQATAWVRDRIAAKLAKLGGAVTDLHLLVYANFSAFDQRPVPYRLVCAEVARPWASAWVMFDHYVFCLSGSPVLPSVQHWLTISDDATPAPD